MIYLKLFSFIPLHYKKYHTFNECALYFICFLYLTIINENLIGLGDIYLRVYVILRDFVLNKYVIGTTGFCVK